MSALCGLDEGLGGCRIQRRRIDIHATSGPGQIADRKADQQRDVS